jgi:hypothetical protein
MEEEVKAPKKEKIPRQPMRTGSKVGPQFNEIPTASPRLAQKEADAASSARPPLQAGLPVESIGILSHQRREFEGSIRKL